MSFSLLIDISVSFNLKRTTKTLKEVQNDVGG